MRATLFLTALLALAAACERGRTRNSASRGGNLEEAAALPTTSNVYRFVGTENALRDARKAVAEERWGEALAAARALLKQEPGHLEANKIVAEAEIEDKSFAAWSAMKKALADRSVAAIATQFRNIAETSRYRAAALPEYERVREQWTVQREIDARALARAGRCRDAGRIARGANELFPEMRPRLDVAAGGCRPASGQDEPEPEAARPVGASPPMASLDPRSPVAAAPVAPVAPVVERPDAAVAPPPAAPSAAAPPAPVVASAAPAATTPAAAAPKVRPKLIPIGELEKLRLAGEKRPALSYGARMVASRDRVSRITIGATMCLDTSGAPSSVDVIKPSPYDDANERVVAEVKRWRFKPFVVDGKPVPVCTALVFIYQME